MYTLRNKQITFKVEGIWQLMAEHQTLVATVQGSNPRLGLVLQSCNPALGVQNRGWSEVMFATVYELIEISSVEFRLREESNLVGVLLYGRNKPFHSLQFSGSTNSGTF